MSLIHVLIVLLIIVAVAYVAFWLIDSAFPEPIRFIAKIIVAVIGLAVLASTFLPALGVTL